MLEIIYGDHTYGKIYTYGGNVGRIIVGKYCSIAGDVKAFLAGDHNFDVISTFPFFHPRMEISKLISKPALPTTQHYNIKHRMEINIGNDVWIGHSAVIFRDVTIGDGAVIGAFAKITKDVSPYTIVVDSNRIVRKRFSDNDIEFLLKLKWWDFEDKVVADIAPILHNPDINLLKKWAAGEDVV